MRWVYLAFAVFAGYSSYADYMERVDLRAENERLKAQLKK